MAVFSIGPVANQSPTLEPISSTVEVRVANTSGADIELTVSAFDAPGAANPGAPETLYFTQLFAVAPNNVALFVIDTSAVTAYEIRVSTPSASVGDVSIAAQGRDAQGFTVPDHTFPNGDWSLASILP